MLWALYPECSFPGLPRGSLPHQLSKSLLRTRLIGGPALALLFSIAPPTPPSFLWVLFTLFCFVSPTPHSTYHRLTHWLVLHVLFIVCFLLLLDCQLHERHIPNTFTGVWHLGRHFFLNINIHSYQWMLNDLKICLKYEYYAIKIVQKKRWGPIRCCCFF